MNYSYNPLSPKRQHNNFYYHPLRGWGPAELAPGRGRAAPQAGGSPEGVGDAVPPNHKREGVAPGTVGSHAPCPTP